MDPLDPLSEIINSGQGFSLAIILERIIWAIIGFFFLGAISTSFTNSIRNRKWFSKKSFFQYFNSSKGKEDSSQNLSKDHNQN